MKKVLLILSVITCGIMMSCNPTCDCNEGCNGNCCGCEQNNDNPVTPPDETEGFINGYAYVDLGLPSGTKWATHNIGATTPEGYGEYYQWGMTTPPADGTYNQDDCTTYGVQMNDDISGNPQYDAARANWGSTWRLPTVKEIEELLNEDICTWECTALNDVNGFKVTGPNGNHIFMPAAGCACEEKIIMREERAWFWTSQPSGVYYGYYLTFVVDSSPSKYLDVRWYVRSIRPVSD